MTAKRFVFREDYDWWEIKDTTGQIKGEYDEWFSCEKVVDLLNKLAEETEQLKQQLKQSVFVNLDGEDGCWNCKHCYGGFCDILENPIVNWIKEVSKCNLKKWELKE